MADGSSMADGSAKTVTEVRDYIDTHDMQGIKAEKRVARGGSSYWDTYTVNGCLEAPAEQYCRLMYSPPICIVIALAILVKVTAMFFASRIVCPQSPPCLTVGDAVESFTGNPDSTTAGMCWMSSIDRQRRIEEAQPTQSDKRPNGHRMPTRKLLVLCTSRCHAGGSGCMLQVSKRARHQSS